MTGSGDGAGRTFDGRPARELTHAVFDVDGTLVRGTTMYGFLHSYHRARPSAASLLLASARLPGGSRAWHALERLTGHDLLRALALSTLRGHHPAEVEAACREYATEVAASGLNPAVVARLEGYRRRGLGIVLASASLEPLVAPLAATLRADGWVASVPAVAHGRYTGRWADDVRGRKLAALSARHGGFRAFAVVTDNLDDGDLIAAAAEVVIVSGPGRRAHWRHVLPSDAEIMEA